MSQIKESKKTNPKKERKKTFFIQVILFISLFLFLLGIAIFIDQQEEQDYKLIYYKDNMAIKSIEGKFMNSFDLNFLKCNKKDHDLMQILIKIPEENNLTEHWAFHKEQRCK